MVWKTRSFDRSLLGSGDVYPYECDGHKRVGSEEHRALQPVGLAVGDDRVYDDDRHEVDEDLELGERKRHGLIHEPAREHDHGHHEKRDLRGRSHCDAHGELHLVVQRDLDSRHVLHSVAHDGQQDDADERLAQVHLIGKTIDGAHEELGEHGHQQGRAKQHGRAGTLGQCGSLLGVLLLVLEEVSVRLELEEEQLDVHEEQEGGGDARERERVGHTSFLRLVVREVEDVAGQQHGERGQHEQRRVGAGTHGVERVFLVAHAAGDEGAAQHEQQVGQHGADERALHHVDLARLEREDGDDHLDGVAEGGVDEPADGLSRVEGQRLGGLAQQVGERDHDEEVEDEDPEVTPAAERGPDGQRRREQHEVERLVLDHVEDGLSCDNRKRMKTIREVLYRTRSKNFLPPSSGHTDRTAPVSFPFASSQTSPQ
ncbi:hypothetical protein ON010_g6302 [Phytophthora cinnamomi]|nr:hypothetical protein ON010_g6302 [Phytophthora cinnamomi]